MWQSLRHQCPLQLQSLHTIHRASTTPIAYQAWHLRATQSHHHLKQRYEHDQQACLLSKNTLQQEEVREHIHTHANTHTHAHTHCNVNIHKLCLQVTTAQCHKHDKHTQAKTGICCSRTSNSHHSMFSTNFVLVFSLSQRCQGLSLLATPTYLLTWMTSKAETQMSLVTSTNTHTLQILPLSFRTCSQPIQSINSLDNTR